MNITKLADGSDMVYGWIVVDETGKRVFYLEDNQGLQKKCDKIVDKSQHSGTIGHHHADYTQGEDKKKKALVRDVQIGD